MPTPRRSRQEQHGLKRHSPHPTSEPLGLAHILQTRPPSPWPSRRTAADLTLYVAAAGLSEGATPASKKSSASRIAPRSSSPNAAPSRTRRWASRNRRRSGERGHQDPRAAPPQARIRRIRPPPCARRKRDVNKLARSAIPRDDDQPDPCSQWQHIHARCPNPCDLEPS